MKLSRKTTVILVLSFLSRSLLAIPLPGEVIGWGDNVAGQATGIPSSTLSNGLILVPDSPYATGIVRIAGRISTNAIAVSADDGFGLAVKGDGTVVAWGDNQAGRA